MTKEEYIKEQRERADNMTLAQARQVVADHYGHDDMRIRCEKAVWMLLNCADEKINNGWIPVSERLPEDRNIVLVTAYWHETYQVMMASYFGEGLWWCVPFNNCGDHMQKLNPKAWMPLPKPYNAESEG